MDIRSLSGDRCGDLTDLFDSNATTRGCYCMWFLVSTREVHSGWGAGNRDRFLALAASSELPYGVLAYAADGTPVGWCAAGPRSRYARALRSPILKARTETEDDSVWLVPCFFTRVGHRRRGVSADLLAAAVEQARAHGAPAIEGFPLAGDRPNDRTDLYLGTEPMFAAQGFRAVARPSARRVVMRLDL